VLITVGVIGGVLLLVVLVVYHAHKTGQPTPLQRLTEDVKGKLQGAALANPALAPLAAGATALDKLVDALDAKIEAKFAALDSKLHQTALVTPAPSAPVAPAVVSVPIPVATPPASK